METSYENVLDISQLIWTGVAVGIHGFMMAVQLGLAAFLMATGLHCLFASGRATDESSASPWLRRLGATGFDAPDARVFGGLRLGLGAMLILPVLLGAPALVSLLACLGALALLVQVERRQSPADATQGRIARAGMIAVAAIGACFMLWEREDPIVLGTEVFSVMSEWRAHEVDWQLATT